MNDSIIPPNRIRHILQEGGSVVGTMVAEIRQPVVMRLLAHAGFDFVIIDNEHGPFTIETIADLSRAARDLGLTPIVRIPDLTYSHIAPPLDAGAQGLMIPRVAGAEQVRQVVQMMKYPPQGRRGCAFNRGHSDFKIGPVPEAMARANRETMLVVQIETRSAVDHMEEIIAVPGLDVAFIGPLDLSIALDVPGQMNHPTAQATIEKMIHTCQRHGVVPAIHMNDLELAVQWVQKGMRLVSSMAETGLIIRAGREVTSAIRAASSPE